MQGEARVFRIKFELLRPAPRLRRMEFALLE
jgi:hypothetical protein